LIYKIKIETDSRAFKGEEGMEALEVSRILEELAEKLNQRPILEDRHLFDARGLRCGSAYIGSGTIFKEEER